jgi:hypothetical protein
LGWGDPVTGVGSEFWKQQVPQEEDSIRVELEIIDIIVPRGLKDDGTCNWDHHTTYSWAHGSYA